LNYRGRRPRDYRETRLAARGFHPLRSKSTLQRRAVMSYSESPTDLLQRAGMISDGHFSLGDLHTSSVIVRDQLFANSMTSSLLCIDIAQYFQYEHVDTVAGPAPRASNLVQFAAKAMYICQDQKRPVYSVHGLKVGEEPSEYHFSEAFLPYLQKKRVLVVVDFMKSGDTMRGFIQAVRDAGGVVVGAASICQRKKTTAEDIGVPRFLSLVHKLDETWPVNDCPLCKKGILPLQRSPNE